MKKKNLIAKIVLPLLLFVALFFGFKNVVHAPTNTESKSVTVNIMVKVDDDYDLIKEINLKDVTGTLGDVIDEINEKELSVIELDGKKDSEFGRFIISIDGIGTEDMKGPWWMINSDTNKDCINAGFCSGIDMQSVYDEDVFDLVFE